MRQYGSPNVCVTILVTAIPFICHSHAESMTDNYTRHESRQLQLTRRLEINYPFPRTQSPPHKHQEFGILHSAIKISSYKSLKLLLLPLSEKQSGIFIETETPFLLELCDNCLFRQIILRICYCRRFLESNHSIWTGLEYRKCKRPSPAK
jgi:hypothetical protein